MQFGVGVFFLTFAPHLPRPGEEIGAAALLLRAGGEKMLVLLLALLLLLDGCTVAYEPGPQRPAAGLWPLVEAGGVGVFAGWNCTQ